MNNQNRNVIVLVRILFLCLPVVGCSKNEEKLYLVKGVLTLNGAPIEKAMITFVPEIGTAARCQVGPNGIYEIRVPQGLNNIAVANVLEDSATDQADQAPPDSQPSLPPQSRSISRPIPPNYMNHKTSNLRFEVLATDDNIYDIKL